MAPSCRWTFLGPSCLAVDAFSDKKPGRNAMSGRVSALALHPQHPDRVVYAGAASGGVWKTIDGGLTWRALSDGADSLNVGAIVIDPLLPERVFVGTGEGNYGGANIGRGEGILRSTDGGEHWVLVAASELRHARVTGMAMDARARHLFVSSSVGVFRHDTGDDSWHELSDLNTSGLALDDRDPDQLRLYAARYGTGIFASDGFGAWTELATGLPDTDAVKVGRIRVATVPGRQEVLYAAYSDGQTFHRSPGRLHGIFRSDNAGASWHAVGVPASPGEQVEYNLVVAAQPGTPDVVLLGLQRLWKTTDGGAHWDWIGDEDEEVPTIGVHADVHAIAFVPGSSSVWIGTDGGVFRSPDAGRSWQHRNRGLGTMQFHTGAHHAEVPTLVLAGSQDNGSQLFAGHPVWTVAKGGEAGHTAIDPEREQRWYAAGYHKVARSTAYDSGFADMHVGGDEARFYPPFVVAPSRPDVLYFGTEQLHRTDGDGEEWETIKEFDQEHTNDHDFISALAVDPARHHVVYVGTEEGRFFRVAHQGGVHAFVRKTASPEPWLDHANGVYTAFISDLAVSPRSGDRVYLVIGNQLARRAPDVGPRVLRSSDAGVTWEDLTDRLPFVHVTAAHSIAAHVDPFHAVVVDPDVTDPDLAHERIFIGGDVGVFESLDGGDSWRARHDGLPNARVYDLQIHGPGRVLRAVTYGRGVWELPLDAPICPPGGPAAVEADIFLRDHTFDGARAATAELSPNPLAAEPEDVADDTDDTADERRLRWYEAPDLKVDAAPLSSELDEDDEPGFQEPLSSVAFDGADLDALGFQALAHRRPRRGATARVYLQVHNRGPDAAANVKARVYWARGDARKGTLPDLPADFWSSFPDAEPTGADWRPIGPAQLRGEVRPADPQVFRWDWAVPRDAPKVIALLAVVTSDDDPVLGGRPASELPLDPGVAARERKHVSLRRTRVNQRVPKTARWKRFLKYAAIGVAVVGAAWVGYELLHRDEEKT